MRVHITDRHPHPKYPRLALQLRTNSKFYQALTFLDGKMRQVSTKTTHLPTALKLSEDWYRRLLRSSLQEAKRHPLDALGTDPTVADIFASYRATLHTSKRAYADMKWSTIQDFWRTHRITEIGAQTFRDFYVWRRRMRTRSGTRVKNHTLHKDVMVIRQILRFAIEEGKLTQLPPIPRVGRIDANPRPWLTKAEYRTLFGLSERRILDAFDKGQERVRWQRIDLHEFIQFMVLTMCRVDEALGVRYRDCRVDLAAKKYPEMLIAQVTGKRGTRDIVAPAHAAVIVKERYRRLDKPDASALIFPIKHRDAFRELLDAAGLRTDGYGNQRNFKSLRATGISFRLLQSKRPDLIAIARNAGTSVQMIDQFYARRLTAEMHAHELATELTGLEDLT
jgi:hypothetical protein